MNRLQNVYPRDSSEPSHTRGTFSWRTSVIASRPYEISVHYDGQRIEWNGLGSPCPRSTIAAIPKASTGNIIKSSVAANTCTTYHPSLWHGGPWTWRVDIEWNNHADDIQTLQPKSSTYQTDNQPTTRGCTVRCACIRKMSLHRYSI